ncbi:E3 ubiquitin-protein ligase, putative [Plasmodium vinckei vinckei]|uniref:E3 ubiquitin-protein ligase, putative n=1 Tax=Plasmodium vinckei vinckei TaxID=54757 RepID=A0A449BW46_PLAVN|nr:E3 ubiquitin-protein ligase, putative [Plasmodium vinckei vinckei]KEG03344.1 hypothetical protein YYE_01368 [Plasmodium vinckei vinckei]VEV57633.1 E3 ubiquitin-protein ligase, putative [Plasmodium vinckei vinckei]
MNQVDNYEYFCHSCEDVKRTSDVEIICDGELKCKSCNNVGFVEKIDEDDPVSFHSVNNSRDSRSNANNSDQNSPNNSNRNSSNTRSSNEHRNSSSHIGGNRSNGNYRIEFTNSGNAFNPNDNIFSDMMFFRNMYQQIYSTGFRTVDGNINFTSNFEPSTNSNRPNEASTENNNGNNARNSGNGNRNDWFSRVFFGTNSRPSNLSSNNTSNNSSSNNDNNNNDGSGASQNNNTRNIRNPRIVTRAIDITNIPLNSPIRLNFHDIIDNILTNSFDNISLDQVLTIIMESDPSRNGPPPASEEIIKNLKVEKLTLERAQELESCAICREEYKENDEVHRITDNERCRHVFHCDCIIPWLKERNSCPTCRFELPTDDQEYNCKREELRERINSEISRNNSLNNSNNNSNNVDVGQDENGTSTNNEERNDRNEGEEKPDNENEERTDNESRNRETNENGDRTGSRNRRGNESGSRTETRYLQFGDDSDLNGLGDFTAMNTSSIIQNIFNNFINGTNSDGSGVNRIFFPQQGSNRNGNRNSDARNIFEESQRRPEHVIVNITSSIDEINGLPTNDNNNFQNTGTNEVNNNRECGTDNGNSNSTTNRNGSNERNTSQGRDSASSAPHIGENIFGGSNFFSSSNLSGLQNLFDGNNLFDTASVIITNISNHNNPSSSINSGSMRFPNVFNNINEFCANISNLHGERNGSVSSPTDSNNNQASNTNNKEGPKNSSDESGNNNNKNGTKKIEKRIYEKVQPSYNDRDNNNSSGSRRSRNDDTEEEITRKKSKNCENYDEENKYTEMNRSTNRDNNNNNKEDEQNEKSNTMVTNSTENNEENGDNNSDCKNPEKQKTVKKYIFNKFNWLKNYDNKEKKKKSEKNSDNTDPNIIQDDDINYKNEKESNTIESETLGKDNKSGYSVQDCGNEEANRSDTNFRGKGKEEVNDMKENISND